MSDEEKIDYIWEMETCIGENAVRLLEHLHGYCHAIKSGRQDYLINKQNHILEYCETLVECCKELQEKMN